MNGSNQEASADTLRGIPFAVIRYNYSWTELHYKCKSETSNFQTLYVKYMFSANSDAVYISMV